MKSAEDYLREKYPLLVSEFENSLPDYIGTNEALKYMQEYVEYAAQQKSEWVPVGERLPDESDGDVIMIFDSKDNLPYTTMYKKPEEWEEYGRVKITHWARITLPSPPKK